MPKLRVMKGSWWNDIPVEKETFRIGRGEDCDYVIKSGHISRHHCEIVRDADGGFEIRDLGTRLGTHVNDHRVGQGGLRFGDKIRLADKFEAVFLDDSGSSHTETLLFMREEKQARRPHLIGLEGSFAGREFPILDDRTLVGRDPSCDICIPLDTISKFHAELLLNGEEIEVVDLNSSNGTFIDEKRVHRARLLTTSRVRFDRVSFKLRQDRVQVGATGTLLRYPDMPAEGAVPVPPVAPVPRKPATEPRLRRDARISSPTDRSRRRQVEPSKGRVWLIGGLLLVVAAAVGGGLWWILKFGLALGL